MIARRARNIGNNRPLITSYRIEQARLSGVRRAGDHDPHAVLQPLGARLRQPVAQLALERAAIAEEGRID